MASNDFLQPSNFVPPVFSEIEIASTLCISEEEKTMHDVLNIILSLLPAFSRIDLNIDVEQREKIEQNTRGQAQSQLWYTVRTRRITASLCGRILCQNEMTTALLKVVLYPHHFELLPMPIQWGNDNEHI